MTILTWFLIQSLLYPAAVDLYQQGKALTSVNCKVPSAQIFAGKERLERQKKMYKEMPSAALRSDMAFWFSKTGNAQSGAILLELLAGEKNDFVRCDLVSALIQLKKEGINYTLPASFCRYFQQKDASVGFRSRAMVLYGMFYPEKAILPIWNTIAGGEQAHYILSTAYPLLEDHAGKIPQEELYMLYKKGSAPGKYGKALHCFAAGLLAGGKVTAEQQDLLLKDLKEAPVFLRMRIAGGIARNPHSAENLLRQCARDPHEAVRLELAKIRNLTALKLETLLSLCDDRSAFVREEACRSLGREVSGMSKAQCSKTFTALLSALKDPAKMVRIAAADSLTELTLNPGEKEQILSQAEIYTPAWEEVISYGRKMKEKSFAPAITEALDSFRKDPILLCTALQVLGELKYVPALSRVIQYTAHKDPLIRKACAGTLGKLRQKGSAGTLKKLLRDKDPRVSTEAAQGMFCMDLQLFAGDFLWLLRTRTPERADQRALAIRALDKSKILPASAWKDLETLLLKPCIVEPMMPPVMEVAPVRLSVLMLLHNRAVRGEQQAKALLQKALAELGSGNKKDDIADQVFDEYFNQFQTFRSGRKVIPGTIECVEPPGAVRELK